MTVLSDQFQVLQTIEPSRAAQRVAKGLAEWIVAPKTAPDTRYGTIRMLPREDASPGRKMDNTTILLDRNGVPMTRLTPRGRGKLRSVLAARGLAFEMLGRHCVVLATPIDPGQRDDIILALSAGIAYSIDRRAALRREIEDVLRRAGDPKPALISNADLERIAQLMFKDLEINRSTSLAEIIVLLGRAGEVLGRRDLDNAPDMDQVRALLDAVRKAQRDKAAQEKTAS